MRRCAILALVAALAIGAVPSATTAQGAIRVFVNGDPVDFDVQPVMVAGRVLVPLRGVFEQLGANVDWEPQTQRVTAVRAGTIVQLNIGSRRAVIDGQAITLDVPPTILHGRTMVPLRFLSEALGAVVDWVPETRSVQIFTGAAQRPPQPGAPQPGARVIEGTVLEVRTGDAPSILVESGATQHRIRVTPATAIIRIDARTGEGGSVALSQVREGDRVRVELDAENRALSIRATYASVTGAIDALAAGSRTIVLANGASYRVAEGARILRAGRAIRFQDLRQGWIVTLQVSPESNVAWEVVVEATGGQAPGARLATPEIAQPRDGATVSNPIRVRGVSVGATRVVITVTPLFGIGETRVETAVGVGGGFDATIRIAQPFRDWPAVITVVGIDDTGRQSDPASIRVNVR